LLNLELHLSRYGWLRRCRSSRYQEKKKKKKKNAADHH
jgi:hypothetical protein